jgi:uncharacterized GH25 family protein
MNPRIAITATKLAALYALACVVGSLARGAAAEWQAEDKRGKTFFAYDRPLPDSIRKAIVCVNVVDGETKAALADVEVDVMNDVDSMERQSSANAQGRLRVVYPYADEPRLWISVRKEGYVPQATYWGYAKERGTPRELSFSLRRGTPIGGTVVDESGKPIEGVTVVASGECHWPDGWLKAPFLYEALSEIPCLTGSDGRWQTSSFPPCTTSVSLSLAHPEYVSGAGLALGGMGLRRPTMEKLRTLTDRQELTSGVLLSGRVVDELGKPIPNARVIEASESGKYDQRLLRRYALHADTDTSGRFRFHFDAYQKVELGLQVKGYEPETKLLSVKPEIEPVEFRLKPGKLIHGLVVDIDGKPIPAASIVLTQHIAHHGVFLRMWTDSQGRFRWDSGPSKGAWLTFAKSGYIRAEGVQLLPQDRDQLITLDPTVVVTIRVRDERTGERIDRFSVERGVAEPDTGQVVWPRGVSALVGGGEFRELPDAVAGPYRYRIKSEGYEPGISRVVEQTEKEAILVIDLKRSPKP